MCGLTGERLQLAVPPVSIKGELRKAGCCGGSWHSGYGGYSQTPRLESSAACFSLLSFLSKQVVFHTSIHNV